MPDFPAAPGASAGTGPATASAPGVGPDLPPALQLLATAVATDRRPTLIATAERRVLLANRSAQRLGSDRLLADLGWAELCTVARRAGSAAVSAEVAGRAVEGDLVFLGAGGTEAFLLRLAESDHAAAGLRNRARAALLLRVAHDLRTPIQSLVAAADAVLAAQADDPATGTEAGLLRAQLRSSASTALDQIAKILDIIRQEEPNAPPPPDEDFVLDDELRAIVTMTEPLARAQGGDIRLVADPVAPIRLHGPVRFVRAVAQNMIDNAIKHGGGSIAVTVRAGQTEGAGVPVTIEVRDGGGGMPAAERERLLDTLAGRVPARPGSGAGLGILAHALRQMQGRLEIDEAVPGTGTVLRARFDLPAAQGPEGEVTAAGGMASLAGLRILVVEDSAVSRDWLQHSLRAAGATVAAAANGHDALARIALPGPGFDIVLLDVTMPRMSGIELTRRLRSHLPAATAPRIVGLTAHVDPQVRGYCLAAGMDLVLEKPIRPADLSQALARVAPQAQAPAPAAAAGEPQPGPLPGIADLDSGVVGELVAELGDRGARQFMGRALDEARAALRELQEQGFTPDTRRTIHSAVGSSGLTGLAAVEAALRHVQDEGRTGADLAAALFRLRDVVERMSARLAGTGPLTE